MSKPRTISRADAFRIFEDGKPHELRLWKLATGDILDYAGAVCLKAHRGAGVHNTRIARSGVVRKFRDCSLFEIDGMKIYW